MGPWSGENKRMSIRFFARLAIADPKTQKISLSREFIEVSEHDINAMVLPDHVVRVDLFEHKDHKQPKRRILMGVEKVYSTTAIEDEFGPFFADRIAETGAAAAAFIAGLGKLIPILPGDEIRHRDY